MPLFECLSNYKVRNSFLVLKNKMKSTGFSPFTFCCRQQGLLQSVFQCPDMLKNVLKFPGNILKNHSTFVKLLIAVIFFLGVMSVDGKTQTVRPLFKFQREQGKAYKLNISQSEFETKYKEFLNAKKRNQEIRKGLGLLYVGENTGKMNLYTFKTSGMKSSPDGHVKISYKLNFSKNIEKLRELHDASLRFMLIPTFGCKTSELVTLSFIFSNNVLQNHDFDFTNCSPRWIRLDLNDEFKLKKNYDVIFKCPGCAEYGLMITEPFLNVILREKQDKPLKRSGRKNEWSGRCTRHEWKVELSKIPGFAHVVEPKTVDLGLCAGNCNALKHFPNQHSHLRYLTSLKNNTIPRGCCSTRTAIPLEVMYADEKHPQNLTTHIWNDTVAVDCECY